MEASFQIPNCLYNGENIYTLRRQWKLSTLPFWRSVPLLRPLDSVSTLVFLSSISIPISMANTGEAGATRDREREGERERGRDRSTNRQRARMAIYVWQTLWRVSLYLMHVLVRVSCILHLISFALLCLRAAVRCEVGGVLSRALSHRMTSTSSCISICSVGFFTRV